MSENIKALDTEQVNPATVNIDLMNTAEILHAINEEDKKVAYAVEKTIPEITKLVDAIHERMMKGGRVIYIGAGTSGRLGILDASECPPTYGVSDQLIQGMIAGGLGAILKAKEGAEDDMELAANDLRALNINETDTIIGLAASGRTPYVIGGLEYAKTKNALTGAISCVHNAQISKHADYGIEAITGPEAITGSTRMKAGTAQKMILNMISTSLMIKYGKVFHNLMVDVQPTNEKLIIRASNIISSASGCSLEEANIYLKKCKNNVKLAICYAVSGLDLQTCEQILQDNQGNVSKSLHNLIK